MRRIEAVLALATARLALAILPFHVVMRCFGLRQDQKPNGRIAAHQARSIGRTIRRVARYMPFRAVCLQQALAAALMLRRRHLAVQIHIGLAHKPDGDVHGHAWCLSGGAEVTGVEEAAGFAPIVVYGM